MFETDGKVVNPQNNNKIAGLPHQVFSVKASYREAMSHRNPARSRVSSFYNNDRMLANLEQAVAKEKEREKRGHSLTNIDLNNINHNDTNYKNNNKNKQQQQLKQQPQNQQQQQQQQQLQEPQPQPQPQQQQQGNRGISIQKFKKTKSANSGSGSDDEEEDGYLGNESDDDGMGENELLEELNKKALAVLNRVNLKLRGKEFQETPLGIKPQVEELILQARDNENLCQAYIGWCPMW